MTSSTPDKVAVVTGASSGIGAAPCCAPLPSARPAGRPASRGAAAGAGPARRFRALPATSRGRTASAAASRTPEPPGWLSP